MATKMAMPLLGQTMEEGTIIRWFKNEGDPIKAGEPLLEVMTDKVNMEVEAPSDGVLLKIYAGPEQTVPVKEPIALIGAAGESAEDALGKAAAPVPAPAPEKAAEPSAPIGPAVPTHAGDMGTAPPVAERIFASPAARRVARERGIDISELAGKGTGPSGRILERDVLDHPASAPRMTPLAGRMAAEMGVETGAVSGSGVAGKITSTDIMRAAQAPQPGRDGDRNHYSISRRAQGRGAECGIQCADRGARHPGRPGRHDRVRCSTKTHPATGREPLWGTDFIYRYYREGSRDGNSGQADSQLLAGRRSDSYSRDR